MTALLILALTLTLSLAALQQARGVADRAAEQHAALGLIENLMASEPRSVISATGSAQGFAWRLETLATGSDRPIAVCRRAVQVTHATSGKRYVVATLVVCPQDPLA